jgi:poly(hydroxyalkanoate) depolymerase family esterase
MRKVLLATTLLVAASTLPAIAGTTVEVMSFGSNPGKLRMYKHIPNQLPAHPALVVVMHGCTQDAVTYTDESGWTQMSDQLGVALVMPQQEQANNSNYCFSWYDPTKTARDKGEALSIKQMVDYMKSHHAIDPKRVFVTGLSAGGAMTSVMLADYPDVFSAGAIISGLPYGCANNLTDALQCMQSGHPGTTASSGVGSLPGLSGGLPLSPSYCMFYPSLCSATPVNGGGGSAGYTAAQWGDFVRAADPKYTGPYPSVSIWHGSADTTVSPANAISEMQQWTNVHKIDPATSVQKDTVNGFPHESYKDTHGRVMVETYNITGMSHGHPVDPGTGLNQCGTADKYVLNEHICSSLHVAHFLGLTG